MNGDAHGVVGGLTEVLAAVAGQICFSVLGALGVSTGTTPHTLRGPMVNKVMALLLLRAGQVVEVDAFIDELWDEQPPRWALSTLRTHVYHLRRQLDEVLEFPAQRLLHTRRSGYLLDIDPEQLDATRFTRLFRDSERLLARGLPNEAAAACRDGLALWQGRRALSTVRPGRVLTGHVQYLEELRVRAHQVRVEAEMRRGRHTHLVPELRDLVAAHPFNEWFHHSLIESLRESGRRGEALSAFQALRTMLRDELGLEPVDGPSWSVPA